VKIACFLSGRSGIILLKKDSYNMKRSGIALFFLLMLLPPRIWGGENHPDNGIQGRLATLVASSAVMVTLVAGQGQIAPHYPRFAPPGGVDLKIRDMLFRGPGTINKHLFLSDFVLYSSTAITALGVPFILGQKYAHGLLLFVEAGVYSALLTQMVKLISARQRPYRYFQTLGPAGAEDNLSFFSGHTSWTAALSATGAFIIGRRYPAFKAAGYGFAVLITLFAGYLRITSDRHYFTDVVAGGLVGWGVAMMVTSFSKISVGFYPRKGGGGVVKYYRF